MLTVTKDSFEVAHKLCSSNTKLVSNCNPIALQIYKAHTINDRGISVDMDLERTKIKTLYTSTEYKKRNLPTQDLIVRNSKQVQDYLVDFYALLFDQINKEDFIYKWPFPTEINFKDSNEESSRIKQPRNVYERWFPTFYNWFNKCEKHFFALNTAE